MSFGEQSDGLHVPKDEPRRPIDIDEIDCTTSFARVYRGRLLVSLEGVRVYNVVVQLPVEDVLKAIDPEEMDRWVSEHYEIAADGGQAVPEGLAIVRRL